MHDIEAWIIENLVRTNSYWLRVLYLLPASLYIALSLLVGEIHPFSRFEMYDSFPSEALAFRVVDGSGKTLPCKELFGLRTADLSHGYAAARNHLSKHETDSVVLMARISESMMAQLLERAEYSKLPDTVELNIVVIRSGKEGPEFEDIGIYRHVTGSEY